MNLKIVHKVEMVKSGGTEGKKKMKQTEPKGPVGNHLGQHTYCGCPEGKAREKGQRDYLRK